MADLSSSLTALVRGQVHSLVAELHRSGLVPREICVESFQDGDLEIYLSLVPRTQPAQASLQERPTAPPTLPDCDLRQIHIKILATATAAPIPAKVLARQAGYQLNSYFRDALRELVRARRLLHGPDGYSLSL